MTLSKPETHVSGTRSVITNLYIYFYYFFPDELGYLVDAIVNEDKIDSFDSRPNNMSIEDKHLLSRLLLLLNPNYSNLAGGGGGGGGRNRRPSRRKKPIINVIEGN